MTTLSARILTLLDSAEPLTGPEICAALEQAESARSSVYTIIRRE